MAVAAQPYSTYDRQLVTDEIRLLHFEAGVDVNAIPTFTLQHYLRNEAPPYTALSYVWGHAETTEAILINDAPFPIRPNLFECLAFLASVNSGKEDDSYMWIDAICINQADVDERNQQVRRMDETYRNAKVVLAWLGPEIQELMDWSNSKIARVGLPLLTMKDRKLLRADVFGRPYWRRLWIVQEISLNRNIVFVFGRQRLDLLSIRIMATSAAEQKGWTKAPRYGVPAYFGSAFENAVQPPAKLWLWVFKTGSCDCQDPRDRIFALLGLVYPAERDVLATFFPDYSMSLIRVQFLVFAFLRWEGYKRRWPEHGTQFTLQDTMKRLRISFDTAKDEFLAKTEIPPHLAKSKPRAGFLSEEMVWSSWARWLASCVPELQKLAIMQLGCEQAN